MILVTGAAGYVGSVLVPLLDDVVVFDKKYGDDILNEKMLKGALKGCDFIVHLAAFVGAPICNEHPQEALDVNYQGTRLLNKLRGNIPIIFTSSGSVYGQVEDVCDETHPINPLTLYSMSKYLAELDIMKHGNYVIYRPATAFGVSPNMRTDLLPNDLTFQAVKHGKFKLFQKDAKRTFIHVVDFAMSLIHAMKNFNKMKNNIYNVGHESMAMTKEDLAKTIQKVTGCEVFFSEGDDPDKRDYEVSYKKIRETGFKTLIGLEEGIKDMVEYYEIQTK